MKQSAGYIIIDPNEKTCLCVRAYANWDFPKGLLDEGESHRQAAAREVQEETTLSIGTDYEELTSVPPVVVTYGTGKNQKTATYFFGLRTSYREPFLPVSPELGKPENDEYRWVELQGLISLLPGLEPILDMRKDSYY